MDGKVVAPSANCCPFLAAIASVFSSARDYERPTKPKWMVAGEIAHGFAAPLQAYLIIACTCLNAG